jgi:hypothetical protein
MVDEQKEKLLCSRYSNRAGWSVLMEPGWSARRTRSFCRMALLVFYVLPHLGSCCRSCEIIRIGIIAADFAVAFGSGNRFGGLGHEVKNARWS